MFIMPLAPIHTMEETRQTADRAAAGQANVPFADLLQEAVQNTRQARAASEQDNYNLAMGNMENLPAMMVRMTEASLALETTTQLVTRAVNSYKEVMQMQI